MARWKRGEAEVEALVAGGDVQKLTGDAANGERLLEKAAVTLETARSAIERDPDSAFVLAYDASRQALTALLAHQGLRPTTKGGHYAAEPGRPCAVRSRLPAVRRPAQATQRARISRAPRRRCHLRRGQGGRGERRDDHVRGQGPARSTRSVLIRGSAAWLMVGRRRRRASAGASRSRRDEIRPVSI